jgi:hypothetical protein
VFYSYIFVDSRCIEQTFKVDALVYCLIFGCDISRNESLELSFYGGSDYLLYFHLRDCYPYTQKNPLHKFKECKNRVRPTRDRNLLF